MIKKVILFLLVLIVIWIVGLFAGIPVIPWIETNYYDSKTNQKLSNGLVLKKIDSSEIRIEIPDYFPASDQCFDTWFTSGQTNSNLIVKAFFFLVLDQSGTELPKKNTYLFGNDDSRFNGTEISNLEIIKNDTAYHEKYKFIRTVFNLRNKKRIMIQIKVDYTINNISQSLTDTLEINKKQALTWDEFRAH